MHVCLWPKQPIKVKKRKNKGRYRRGRVRYTDRRKAWTKNEIDRHQQREKIEKGAVVQHADTAEFCGRIQGWQALGCAEAILGIAVED